MIIAAATIAIVHLKMHYAPHKAPCYAQLKLSSEPWLAKLGCAKYVLDHVLREIVLSVCQCSSPRAGESHAADRSSPQNQHVAPGPTHSLMTVHRGLIFRDFRRFFPAEVI